MNRTEPASRRPGICLAELHQAFEPSERLGGRNLVKHTIDEPVLFNRSGIGIDGPVFRHAFSLVEILFDGHVVFGGRGRENLHHEIGRTVDLRVRDDHEPVVGSLSDLARLHR
jgi:hypothetical protein